MKELLKEFNIVIAGVGGQGVITLQNILCEAALLQGYDVKASEIHGLAQRGGPVPCHVRFGRKIYSPLVLEGEANLILGLEPLETLRMSYYGSKDNQTVFLMNTKKTVPISVSILKEKYPSLNEIVDYLGLFSSVVITLNASEIVERETGDSRLTNVFMLGYAFVTNVLPLQRDFLMKGIEKIVPKKFIELNKKIFELGEKTGRKSR